MAARGPRPARAREARETAASLGNEVAVLADLQAEDPPPSSPRQCCSSPAAVRFDCRAVRCSVTRARVGVS
jgi:hypothetical protein